MKTSAPVNSELEADLRKAMVGEVRFDPYSRAMYSTDGSIYEMEPIGVVVPRSVEDIQAVIDACNRHKAWVLPRGGGTSLSGQTVNHAVVIDFSKYLHNILEIAPEENWVRTEPGITIDELNRELRPHRLMFAPDPSTSSRATIGGALGNNSCGAHSIVYGKTVDHVLEMESVLSDTSLAHFKRYEGDLLAAKLSQSNLEGNIYRDVRSTVRKSHDAIKTHFPKTMRRNGGYNIDRVGGENVSDLTQIMVGSEGTLATVTSAKLNLVPIPKYTALAVVHFTELNQAMEATVATLEESPSAVEHIGSLIIDQARNSLGFSNSLGFIQGEPRELLIVEFSGDDEREVHDRTRHLEVRLTKARMGYAVTKLFKNADKRQVWGMRQAGLGLMMRVEGNAKPLPFVEDTAVPPEKLPEYVEGFNEILKRHGTTAGYYGHASVGCLHIRPIIDTRSLKGQSQLVSIAREVCELVLKFNGALTGEHGDGIVRGFWTEKMFGPDLAGAFRQIKNVFDPNGIMNPGKIFDTPHITDNLRHGETYSTPKLKTRLDFSNEGGLAAAIEMCNGVGQCRKLNAGVMCPSYMATREEEHSTRGRANALRFAISGRLETDLFNSKRMLEVLDLCLECKSCKSECPSGVDMAKIKYEFLHNYYQSHSVPVRSRIISDIHRINAATAPFAPVANAVVRSLPIRWLMDKTIGIDQNRPIPPVVRNTFEKWFSSKQHPPSADSIQSSRGQIILFHDTFTNFNYPRVGIAATRLLENLGFRVTVLRKRRCCGRPMISKGMLDRAADNARHNVELLYPFVKAGITIAGCESSCVMTIKDEWPDLLVGDKRAREVANSTLMVEDVLANTVGDHKQQINFSGTEKDVKFFGHCHQKAITGTSSSITALGLPPGYRVTEIEAGCCGMAGSFGFEKDHVKLSMSCGQDRLFPSILNESEKTEIAINGVSCRQQIEYGTSRIPRHLLEILADAIKE